MSATECSNPARMKTGMQNRMPTIFLLLRKMLTARYIRIPQKQALRNVAGTSWRSLEAQTVSAVVPEAGTAYLIARPQRTVAQTLPSRPSSRTENSSRPCFSGMNPILPV